MTLEEAKAVLAALVNERVGFVVIGSMAMAAQGLPRATHAAGSEAANTVRGLGGPRPRMGGRRGGSCVAGGRL